MSTIRRMSKAAMKEPLAVILPWMYSNPKPVEKYVQMYKQKGIKNVLVITPTFDQIFYPQFYMKKRISITDNILNQANESSCVVVHAISAGTMIFGSYLKTMDQFRDPYRKQLVDNFRSMPKSLFMDSPTEPEVIYDALGYSSFPGKINSKTSTIKDRIGWSSVKWSTAIMFKYLLRSSDKDMWDNLRFFENCKKEFNFNPVAIVSSKTDPVVDYNYCYLLARKLMGRKLEETWKPRKDKSSNLLSDEEMNQIVEECKKEDIVLQILERSPHVTHWMTHKALYEQLVDHCIKAAIDRRINIANR